ncbi:hypothetical protein BD310DRAFT_920063 [Dichomitus squalens]|uniref:Uncharacterized protein n=1 Tax=Dichomitus squalens TaxID=114155 RepID=A0A4Q9Q3X4_9APHY|nr:hypothetical protein BD310DRAFT_920063 [Dichomitus squalens]
MGIQSIIQARDPPDFSLATSSSRLLQYTHTDAEDKCGSSKGWRQIFRGSSREDLPGPKKTRRLENSNLPGMARHPSLDLPGIARHR